jgi:hypothetical protein
MLNPNTQFLKKVAEDYSATFFITVFGICSKLLLIYAAYNFFLSLIIKNILQNNKSIMRRLLFIFFFVCISMTAPAQLVYPYGDIKLEKPGDYVATEPMALSAAVFLLTTPFAEKDDKRLNAINFLSNWMAGTKAYSFYMKGMAQDVSDDVNLIQLYVAAMAKYTLENRLTSANPLTVDANAAKIVLAYCDEPKNNFKLKKKYRKILEKN